MISFDMKFSVIYFFGGGGAVGRGCIPNILLKLIFIFLFFSFEAEGSGDVHHVQVQGLQP